MIFLGIPASFWMKISTQYNFNPMYKHSTKLYCYIEIAYNLEKEPIKL
jgi:hypothetical protein